jgi:hypothetical protein
MKKILFIVCGVFSFILAKAQTSGAVVTTSPSTFTAEDKVKIIVNVANVGNLKGKEPLYIWTWDPGEPAPGNGSWDNSNEARRMTKEGTDLWSWTITPSTYYGKAPADIKQIQFLVKAKSGNGDAKTDDIKLIVAPLTYVETVFRSFPRFAGQDEVITGYLNQALATDFNSQRMTPKQAKVSIYDANGVIIDSEKTVNLTAGVNSVFSFTVFPPKTFVIPAGKLAIKMKVIFTGTILDANGNPQTVDSPAFEKGLDNLK